MYFFSIAYLTWLLSGGARTAERVVPAAVVGHDGEEHVAFGRDQARSGREVDVALLADGVDRAVAIARIDGRVEERIDRLVALEVDDAEKSGPS